VGVLVFQNIVKLKYRHSGLQKRRCDPLRKWDKQDKMGSFCDYLPLILYQNRTQKKWGVFVNTYLQSINRMGQEKKWGVNVKPKPLKVWVLRNACNQVICHTNN